MKKWICLAVIAAAAVTLAAATQAEPGSRWPKFWERKKAVEELGLKPEQISQLADLDFKYAKSAIELQAKAKAAQLNFDHLIKKGETDEKAISALIAQIADARREQIAQGLQRMVEARAILTPEQWEKVYRMISRMRGERSGRGGKGPGMKGGGWKGGEGEGEGRGGHGPGGRGGEGYPMMGPGAPAPAPAEVAPPAEK